MIQRKKHVTVLLQSKDQEVTMILFPDLFAWGGSHICFWLRLCCFSHISSVGGWEGKVEPSPAPCSWGRMQKCCYPEFVLPLPSFLTVQATRPGAQGAWHQSQSGLPWKSWIIPRSCSRSPTYIQLPDALEAHTHIQITSSWSLRLLKNEKCSWS